MILCPTFRTLQRSLEDNPLEESKMQVWDAAVEDEMLK